MDEFWPKRQRNDFSSCDEVDKYLTEPKERVRTEDIIDWWNLKSEKYPRLSTLARKMLAVPCTSSSSESVFSRAGRTITELRSKLCPETVWNFFFFITMRNFDRLNFAFLMKSLLVSLTAVTRKMWSVM